LGGVESTLIAGLLSDTFLKPSVAFWSEKSVEWKLSTASWSWSLKLSSAHGL
jgi:hypothetical protein